ncbi:LysR family transcriptional regulator [Streptomyces sp. NPDC005438]|uniref:LysR family transcriptional regulator n=1 Tax=Streptomyces sp. NPDC005438 TaxID=3156880 RepID=UPI0033A3C53E
MYDLHRLRLLRELSHRGTLAAVAEALGYSPSAISHQLSILERETGVPLLEPAGRGVRLTPAATGLVAHTEAIMRELERAEADIAASRSQVTGTVRVATFQTAAHTLVLDAIDRLADPHPQLTVTFAHLNAEAAVPALLARDFDLVLSEDYPGLPSAPHPGVTTRTLTTDPLLLAVPARWSARELAELADVPWVMEHPGTAARTWSTSACRTAGFEPRVRYETADLHLHAAIVARGRTAAFLPRLGHDPTPGIRLVPTGHARTITLSIRAGSGDNPAVTAFQNAVTAV